MQTSFEKYLPWFTLREIPFIGNRLYKRLIDEFHAPETVLTASVAQLKKIENISGKIIKNIVQHKVFQDKAKKELDKILSKNIKIVTLADASYPALLKQIHDPPPFLTYLGTLDNKAPCIAVVGSRTATAYGLSTSETLSFHLARKGFQIVSGLARGIDSMAHKGALRAKGKTIAVMGSGLNKIYPRENKPLFHAIADTGTVFSEFRADTDPFPSNFPIRNRIIAGLSCGSIIVEAAQKSGSLITARLAGEYNREVFAVPGSIQSKKSQGTHALLKQGAKLVETENDIMDELHHFIHPSKKYPKDALQNQKPPHYTKGNGDPVDPEILNFIGPYPVHIDMLIETSGMDSSQVTSQLLDLELAGKINHRQGNYYSLSEENH